MIQEHQFECDYCYGIFDKTDIYETDIGSYCEECFDIS
jgi:hypothetical protein